MPELPETETIARDLDALLKGRVISQVRVNREDVLRGATQSEFGARCLGSAVTEVWRRAKSVVMDLANGEHLLIQPRFTGAVLVESPTVALADDPYIAVEWRLADGGAFGYRDVRRLGTVAIADDVGLALFDERLGIEPLDASFTASRLSGLLRVSRQAVKKVLMDQRRVAGVGNIYATEALWRAMVDPSRPAASLSDGEAARLRDGIVTVLTEAVAARGTTFRDYRDAHNARGDFARQLAVYGRGGGPCRRCSTRLTETHAVDGRSTVFCFRCQR